MNRDVARVLNARTYAQAEALGLDDVITICSTCTGHMRAANKELLENEEQMNQANSILGKFGAKYSGNVTVRHLLWLLIDDIGLDNLRSMVVRPLNGLKVAPFYGCHIIRPESVNGWESARNPHSLEDIISAIGGEPIDYAGKTRCCGFHIQLEKDNVATDMVGQNMRMDGQGSRRRSGAHTLPALSSCARRLSTRFGRPLGSHRSSDVPSSAIGGLCAGRTGRYARPPEASDRPAHRDGGTRTDQLANQFEVAVDGDAHAGFKVAFHAVRRVHAGADQIVDASVRVPRGRRKVHEVPSGALL